MAFSYQAFSDVIPVLPRLRKHSVVLTDESFGRPGIFRVALPSVSVHWREESSDFNQGNHWLLHLFLMYQLLFECMPRHACLLSETLCRSNALDHERRGIGWCMRVYAWRVGWRRSVQLVGYFYRRGGPAVWLLCSTGHLTAGLLISNIDVDTIADTFEISISVSTILSYKSIDRGIDDTFWPFLSTLNRYFSADMQNDAHN